MQPCVQAILLYAHQKYPGRFVQAPAPLPVRHCAYHLVCTAFHRLSPWYCPFTSFVLPFTSLFRRCSDVVQTFHLVCTTFHRLSPRYCCRRQSRSPRPSLPRGLRRTCHVFCFCFPDASPSGSSLLLLLLPLPPDNHPATTDAPAPQSASPPSPAACLLSLPALPTMLPCLCLLPRLPLCIHQVARPLSDTCQAVCFSLHRKSRTVDLARSITLRPPLRTVVGAHNTRAYPNAAVAVRLQATAPHPLALQTTPHHGGGFVSVQQPAPGGANKRSFPRGAFMQHLAPRRNPERSNGHLTALD